MYDLGVGSQLFLGWRGLLSDPAVSAALRHELANVQLRPLPAEELQEVCLCCLNTETGRYKPQKRGHMGSCFTCGWRRGFFNSPLATESAIRWLVRLGDLVFHQRILELMAAHLPTDP